MSEMRGGTTRRERDTTWLNRVSARQRVVVLTFDTVTEAEAWDAAGCPLSALLLDAVEVVDE